MCDRKIVIVVFGRLSTKKGQSTDNFHYRIARYFFGKGLLEKIYCIDYDSGVEIPALYIDNLNKSLPVKILFKLSQYIRLIYRDFPQRLFNEFVFDILVALRLQKKSSHLLLNLKAVDPIVVRKARKLGLKIISFATIAHPVFNYNMVKKIQKQYNLPDRSIYTNKMRVKRVSDTFRNSDKTVILVRSKFVLNTYISNGIDEQNLIVLENSVGVDTKTFTPGKKNNEFHEVVFMTLGYLNLIKGIPLLLQAWSELTEEENINARLIVAGPMDRDIKSVVEGIKGNIKNIVVSGLVKSPMDVYNNADVFIATSVSDSGPWTVFEAMACGLPVIVSSHCGYSEYIDEGKDGFVYDPFDIDRLKKLIRWFIENKEKIPVMGNNARDKSASQKTINFMEDLHSISISCLESD